ncbi:unnamed protein product, partial [Ectocarpus sp. 12 AP-2014]
MATLSSTPLRKHCCCIVTQRRKFTQFQDSTMSYSYRPHFLGIMHTSSGVSYRTSKGAGFKANSLTCNPFLSMPLPSSSSSSSSS